MKDNTKKRRLLTASKKILIFLCALTLGACEANNTSQEQQHNTQTQDAECGHCGMPVDPFPTWKVRVAAKPEKWYCSPRCMFMEQQAGTIAASDSVLVSDYYDTRSINGREAFYVVGSDVAGSMGHDAVPFATQQAAQDFLTEHKGKRVLRFGEITTTLLDSLVSGTIAN